MTLFDDGLDPARASAPFVWNIFSAGPLITTLRSALPGPPVPMM